MRQTPIALLIGALLLPQPLLAKDRGESGDEGFFERSFDRIFGRDEEVARVPDKRGGDDWARVVISDDERRVIRDYYGRHPWSEEGQGSSKPKKLPPGLQKKVARGGELPPGWQKKMARGQMLPHDIYVHHFPLPDDILRRLPRPPHGTETIRVEGKIVRVISATREILDVFDL